MKKKEKFLLFIQMAIIVWTFLGAANVSALVLVSNDIINPETWTKEKSPYIIRNSIAVKAPVVIEAGTVIKFQNYESDSKPTIPALAIKSAFKAVGDPLDKIIFTSACDSSYGGNTAEFCSAQHSSGEGSWSQIQIYPEYRSPVSFEYVEILYAMTGINYSNSFSVAIYKELSIKNSRISFCSSAGISLMYSQPTMDGLTLTDNDAAFYLNNSLLEAMPKIRNSVISGNKKTFNYYNFPHFDAQYNYWGDPSGPKYLSYDGKDQSNPDGLGGTIFSSGILFRPWDQTDPTIPKEPLIFVPGIGASINPDLMISGVLADNWTMFDHTYDGILKAFQVMGYREGKNFFIAYYDWRQSNAQSAQEYLKPLIQRALKNSDATKVNIVTHSMGSLVARSYVQGNSYASDVDNLIMIAPPNKGSSDVYAMWEGGYVPKNWKSGWIMNAYINYLKLANAKSSGFDVIHKFIPSLKDLMPVYDYLYQAKNPQDLKSYASMVEKNNFLLDLNQDIDRLNKKTRLSVILGDKQPTVNKIPTIDSDVEGLWKDGKPDPIDPKQDDTGGDGEVLFSSGSVKSDFSAVLEYGHSEIVSRSEKIVAQRLNEELNEIFVSPDIDDEIIVWTDAPAELQLIDPDGFIMSEKLSQITDGIYAQEKNKDGFKIASVPNVKKGQYDISLKGNDNGAYHVAVEYVDHKNSDNDKSQLQTVEVKKDETQNLIVPTDPKSDTAPIGDVQLKDETPPSIEVDSPKDGAQYLSDQILPITFSVSDNVSKKENIGTQVYLDDDEISSAKSIDLSKLALGQHDFSISAFDEKENWNWVEMAFIVKKADPPPIVPDPPPVVSDPIPVDPPIVVDITSPILKIQIPEDGGKYKKSEKITIKYEVSDDISKPSEIKKEILLDDKELKDETLDFSQQEIGSHVLKISATDLAGNKKESSAAFSVVADVADGDLELPPENGGGSDAGSGGSGGAGPGQVDDPKNDVAGEVQHPEVPVVDPVVLAVQTQPTPIVVQPSENKKKSESSKKKSSRKTKSSNSKAKRGGVTKSKEKIKIISLKNNSLQESQAPQQVLGVAAERVVNMGNGTSHDDEPMLAFQFDWQKNSFLKLLTTNDWNFSSSLGKLAFPNGYQKTGKAANILENPSTAEQNAEKNRFVLLVEMVLALAFVIYCLRNHKSKRRFFTSPS